jgi:hypothetical protein
LWDQTHLPVERAYPLWKGAQDRGIKGLGDETVEPIP